jgi:hypothetical protein
MKKYYKEVDRGKLGKKMLIQALIGLSIVYIIKIFIL